MRKAKGLWMLVLLTVSGWLAPLAQAQPQRLRFEHLGIEHGLVQGTVVNIMQDRQGFLWIATEGGLHRHDGHTFETYTSTSFDTTSLSNSIVQSVVEAENGDLWVATLRGGLNRLDRATGRFIHYRYDPDDDASLSSDRTRDALQDRHGNLWVATLDGGLNRMRAGQDSRFTHYRHDPDDPASLSHDQVYTLSEGADGHIWAGSANGINRIDPETETITRFLYSPEGTRGYSAPYGVFGVYVPPETPRILWLATDNGLVRLHTRTGAHERFLIEPERDGRQDPLNGIRQVVADPSDPDVLWVVGPAVWRVLRGGQAEKWVQDEALEGTGAYGLGIPIGANGIVVVRGGLLVANAEKGQLVSVPIRPDGSAGQPTVVIAAPALFGLDGITADAQGNIYGAVNAGYSVVRISRDGTDLSEIASGTPLDFPTGLTFGTGRGRHTLFIVNSAFLSAPEVANPAVLSVRMGR
jgi:sugar lactone lactonase YvrE